MHFSIVPPARDKLILPAGSEMPLHVAEWLLFSSATLNYQLLITNEWPIAS